MSSINPNRKDVGTPTNNNSSSATETSSPQDRFNSVDNIDVSGRGNVINDVKAVPGNSTLAFSDAYKAASPTGDEFVKHFNETNPDGTKGSPVVTVTGGKALFNDYAIYCLVEKDTSYHAIKNFRDDPNSQNPLAGNSINKPEYMETKMANILDYFQDNPTFKYHPQDFLWCKYHGLIPNNRLVTLRRFLHPTVDSLDFPDIEGAEGKKWPPIAKALTWFGAETGNSLNELLTFSVGFPWEDVTADVWEHHGQEKGWDDMPPFMRAMAGGRAGRTASQYSNINNSDASGRGEQAQQAATMDNWQKSHPNQIYGPINVINKTTKRGRGLNFDHSIKLVFEYNLSSVGLINPKVALLDIMCNMLALCYNYAPWWGGENRYFPKLHRAPFLGDQKLFYQGKYIEYFQGFFKDLSTMASNMASDLQDVLKPKSAGDAIQKIQQLMGGGLKLFFDIESSKSRPEAVVLNGLVSGAPVGEWHLVVGNPFNPIVQIGNLILDKATFEWGEELGLDDFPTNLKVTIELKHGRPRDGAEIQSMFNRGRGKIYYTIPQDTSISNSTVRRGGTRPCSEGIIGRYRDGTPSDYTDCLFNASIRGINEGGINTNSLRSEILKFGGLFGSNNEG